MRSTEQKAAFWGWGPPPPPQKSCPLQGGARLCGVHVGGSHEERLLDDLVVEEGRGERAQLALHLCDVAAVDVLLQHAADAPARLRQRQRRVCMHARPSDTTPRYMLCVLCCGC